MNVPGVDCGDEVSKWIEKYLDKPGSGYRLLYFSPALPTRHLTYGPERLLGSTKDDDQVVITCIILIGYEMGDGI